MEIIQRRLFCGASRETAAHYTPLITMGNVEGAALAELLYARLEAIYAARPAEGDCYMHGMYSESLMPALLAVRSGEVSRISEIYAKGLNPEKIPLRRLPVVTAAPVVFESSFLAAMSSSRGRLTFGEKLLAKCSSPQKQDGVRYIRQQVLKALKSENPLDRDIGRSFLMCMLLGTMPGAPMAPPQLRVDVHLHFDREADRALKALSSRALWLGLIFWVNKAASSSPVLRRLRAPGGCATSVDKRMEEQLKTVVANVLPAVQGAPGARVPTFVQKRKATVKRVEGFINRLPKKRRLREDVIRQLTGVSDLAAAKVELSKGYELILREAPHTPWAPASPLLGRLGWDNAAGHAVFDHAVTQRREFTLLPCHSLLAEAQRRAAPNGAFVAVCLACFTLRTRPRGQAAAKATEGTIMLRDPAKKELCANCYSSNVEYFDLCGMMVTSLNRAIEQRSSMCTVCTGCGYPAAIEQMHGLEMLCKSCARRQDPSDVFDRICACCGRVLSKRGHYKAVVFEGTPNTIKLVCPTCQDAESSSHLWSQTMTSRNPRPRRSWTLC